MCEIPSNAISAAAFTVEQGIDSISLNPDAVVKTTKEGLGATRRSA